jgi:acyl dehydratase
MDQLMPLSTQLVGQQTKAFDHEIDARWTMAYASGLSDTADCYMDTAIRPDVIAHPVFPVCVEWPVILDARNIKSPVAMTNEEAARGVHASHDLHILKPIRAGDRLTTRATILGIEEIKPGAAQYTRLDTHNQHGEPVTKTYQLGISRGVEVVGPRNFIEEPPPWPEFSDHEVLNKIEIPVDAGAANIYTETARIFNPIHSDRAVALAAGLPDIILHGTATLALAVSQIVNHHAAGKPEKIVRLGGRFSAMVLMPSTLTLVVHQETESGICYTLLTDRGQEAISNGFVCWQ